MYTLNICFCAWGKGQGKIVEILEKSGNFFRGKNRNPDVELDVVIFHLEMNLRYVC